MTKIYKPLPEVHYRPLPDYLTIKKSELNINNEDVICTHGCTIGTLDENHLFYLQHRGLTYE
jgi:Fe-S cluster assembly protein SufD